MYWFGSSFANFISDNFLILYNMNSNSKDLVWVAIEVVALVLSGVAGVYCLFLLLSLIRGMVV